MTLVGSVLSLSRSAWVDHVWKISAPVIENAARGTLRASMPVRGMDSSKRAEFSHLEAVGRTLAGLSGWLGCHDVTTDEGALLRKARALSQAALASIVEPGSPDHLNFSRGRQPLVDAAYLAQAILRAPDVLWKPLPQTTRKQIVIAMISTRRIPPYFNNWLLFSAMIEAFLFRVGAACDVMRIDCALRQMEQWYEGDGVYADGPRYRCDYYNSFVIHPFLIDILDAIREMRSWEHMRPIILLRAQRYAELLERMISPEGTMPVTGRSLAYRCGSVHALAHLALLQKLPSSLKPAQVRCAMSAVIARTLSVPGTYDEGGWLQIGHCGTQPSLGEEYISTGSVYLATLAFLPLGLPAQAPFWVDPDTPFSSRLVYGCVDAPADAAPKWDK